MVELFDVLLPFSEKRLGIITDFFVPPGEIPFPTTFQERHLESLRARGADGMKALLMKALRWWNEGSEAGQHVLIQFLGLGEQLLGLTR